MENNTFENILVGEAVTRSPGLSHGRGPSAAKNSYPPLDRATVALLKSGDHEAFDKVFRAFYGRVKSFVRVVTKSDELADELSQKVFVNLWLYRANIDPAKNFNAYIYTMARNAAMSALRAQLRQEDDTYGLPEEGVPASAEADIIARETELLVKMTVSRMPPKRRQVYRMSREEGKSNEEISRELTISRKVVEKHLRLALHEIREAVRVMILFF